MRKFFLTFLFFLTLALTVFAQHPTSAWMHSYTAETADKKYLFVMRDLDRSDYFVSDKYEKSGMYLNDGSTTPLWTLDWKESIYLPNDGKHIIRLGRLPYSATYREEAFTLLAEGKDIKTYQTRDLITFPYLLPHSSNGYDINHSPLSPDLPNDGVLMKVDNGKGYPLNSGVIFNNENQTMQIETLHGDKYLFDFTTGEIISSSLPSRNTAIGLFCVLIILYFVYASAILKSNLSRLWLIIANYTAGFYLSLFLFLIPVVSVWLFNASFDEYKADYPDFVILCFMQISILPEYLLTSLHIFSPSENNMASIGFEAMLQWLVVFWLPLVIFVGLLNHICISKLSRNNFR
jgi:hypothetical protein